MTLSDGAIVYFAAVSPIIALWLYAEWYNRRRRRARPPRERRPW